LFTLKKAYEFNPLLKSLWARDSIARRAISCFGVIMLVEGSR